MKKEKQNLDRVTADPAIMVGKPIIRGTRLTVEFLLGQLAQGLTREEMLQHYPPLAQEDITAAINYAAELVAEQKVYPLLPHRHGQTLAFA